MASDPPPPGPVDQPLSRRARRAQREAEARAASRRSWPQRILLSVLVLSVFVASGAAALVGYGLYKIEQIARVEVALAEAPPGAPKNFLLVGSDTRDTIADTGFDTAGFTGEGAEGSGQRSDTIMVIRVDPAEESVAVLSFPRDLWLPIAGTGHSQRINTAYAAGPQRLVDTIELNFDLPIHHYIEVDFAGFAGLVDAIGGVPMWFDHPLRDTHSGLHIDSEGCHVLDPQMALAFARSRHLEYRTDNGWSTDGTGDLGRITRQQVFLRRSLDQVSNLGITDAFTLNRLANVGIDSVTLDQGLSFDTLLDLGRRFASFDGDQLRTHSLPVYPYRTSGGASVLGLEEAEAQPILNLFRGLPADALSPAQVANIVVLNGTGETGQAGLVADALEQVGFGVTDVGDADDVPQVQTTIRYGSDAEQHADLLARHLSAGAELVADQTLDREAVVLVTGTDFTTVNRRPTPATNSAEVTTSSSISRQPGPGATTSTTEAVGVAPDASASCT